jgi:hypothetical protein
LLTKNNNLITPIPAEAKQIFTQPAIMTHINSAHFNKIYIIDIGTHKGQEALLIECNTIKFILQIFTSIVLRRFRRIHYLISGFKEFSDILKYKNKLKHFDKIFVFVEPILHRSFLHNLHCFNNFIFLNGVTTLQNKSSIDLYLAKNDLGNSVFPEKPGLKGEKINVCNFRFDNLLESIYTLYNITEDDLVILRINAEGVEKEIIEFLYGNKFKHINYLFGSLGDIKKVFGPEESLRIQSILNDSGVEMIYFTSSPYSWHNALKSLVEILERK